MNQKTVHNYDARNGLYTGTSVPDRNPEYDNAMARALAIRERAERGEATDDEVKLADLLATEPEFHFPAHCTEVPLPALIPDGFGAYFQGNHATREGSWEVLPLPREAGQDPAPERTQQEVEDERMAAARALVQSALDAVAHGLGYTDAAEAMSYADEPSVPKYQKQGQLVRAHRSRAKEWLESELVAAEVRAGRFGPASLQDMPGLYPPPPEEVQAPPDAPAPQ